MRSSRSESRSSNDRDGGRGKGRLFFVLFVVSLPLTVGFLRLSAASPSLIFYLGAAIFLLVAIFSGIKLRRIS